MSCSHWKNVERAVMARLGGKRIPVTGRQRGAAADGEHDWLCPEIKSRKSVPAWLQDAMRQAVAAQEGDHQLPIVVVHQAGQRHDEDLVVVRMRDWVKRFGGEDG